MSNWDPINTGLILAAIFLVLILVVVGGAVIAAADGGNQDTDTASSQTTVEMGSDKSVERFIDHEAGVVCWVFTEEGAMGSGAGWESGISCLPYEDTNLQP